jgi:thiamine-phosphate pyrophosphorylase
MELEKIQFITHQNSKYNYLDSALLALEGGIRFIQLRMKNSKHEEVIKVGKVLKEECKKYDAQLIIDDYVDLVNEIGACGVHLGLKDMPIDIARKRLDKEKIIGGTANCFEDVLMQYKLGAEYIGVGPFTHTTTKQNLSKILGLQGYEDIIEKCKKNNINIPIYAIGGIRLNDLEAIKQIGVYGLAISSIILESPSPLETIKEIIHIWN